MITAVYADGGCVGHNPSTIAGTWAACLVDEHEDRAREVSGVIRPRDIGSKFVTNNHAEFYGLLRGLEELPDGWSGTACSDSKVTLGRFFLGWKLTAIPPEWSRRMGFALRRLGKITPLLVNGHPTKLQLLENSGHSGRPVSSFNVWCDLECKRQGQMFLARRRLVAS